jgi:hypothetical protein
LHFLKLLDFSYHGIASLSISITNKVFSMPCIPHLALHCMVGQQWVSGKRLAAKHWLALI